MGNKHFLGSGYTSGNRYEKSVMKMCHAINIEQLQIIQFFEFDLKTYSTHYDFNSMLMLEVRDLREGEGNKAPGEARMIFSGSLSAVFLQMWLNFLS